MPERKCCCRSNRAFKPSEAVKEELMGKYLDIIRSSETVKEVAREEPLVKRFKEFLKSTADADKSKQSLKVLANEVLLRGDPRFSEIIYVDAIGGLSIERKLDLGKVVLTATEKVPAQYDPPDR